MPVSAETWVSCKSIPGETRFSAVIPYLGSTGSHATEWVFRVKKKEERGKSRIFFVKFNSGISSTSREPAIRALPLRRDNICDFWKRGNWKF